jgi:hypothetical protein
MMVVVTMMEVALHLQSNYRSGPGSVNLDRMKNWLCRLP